MLAAWYERQRGSMRSYRSASNRIQSRAGRGPGACQLFRCESG